MDGTVNLFGSRVKKSYVYAGGAVIALVFLYGWYKNKHSAAANEAAASGTAASGGQYPPDGTTGNPSDPYSTDPATGQTYGDEGQFTANSGGYGSYGYDGYGGYGYGGNGNGRDQDGNTVTTNAEWAQAAQSYLTGHGGGSSSVVAAALGAYISGKPLTGDQVTVVEEAIAFEGAPPRDGPGGYPPHIRTGPPQTQDVKVPRTDGRTAGEAHDLIVAAGLRPEAPPQQRPDWIVTGTSPAAGREVPEESRVTINARPPRKQ